MPTKPNKRPKDGAKWLNGINNIDEYSGFGVGIVCGPISGGLECIDFDNHFGGARKNLNAFVTDDVKEIIEKHKLPLEKTLNDGYHLVYRCSVVEGNLKLASVPELDNKGTWKPDCIAETRGEGGYFVAAPTKGYKVLRNSLLEISTITPEERGVLIDSAKSLNTWHTVVKVEQEEGDRPGDIYNEKPEAIIEAKSALRSAGWVEVRDQEWRRPDKKEGSSATFGRVAENVFYVFSSSAYPFEPNRAYTPFQIVTLLDHGGDFKVFATELSKRYSEGRPAIVERKIGGPGVKPVTESEYEGVLRRASINLEIPVTKPPVVMTIRDVEGVDRVDRRLFTLGNFSCITGKSKSKKTFLASLFLATATSNSLVERKFESDFPGNKQYVLLFDTEQSEYDAYVTAKRIPRILGAEWLNFRAFDLREYSPKQRCDIIEYALSKKFKDNVGYVVIDGIADLATAINDEEEASRVVSLLMKWTKVYNTHITTVIHQNKNDNYATGHLGSAIMKKSECVISVKKSDHDYRRSDVSCDLMRGASDFNDFEFEIDDRALPRIVSIDNMA